MLRTFTNFNRKFLFAQIDFNSISNPLNWQYSAFQMDYVIVKFLASFMMHVVLLYEHICAGKIIRRTLSRPPEHTTNNNLECVGKIVCTCLNATSSLAKFTNFLLIWWNVSIYFFQSTNPYITLHFLTQFSLLSFRSAISNLRFATNQANVNVSILTII